MKLYVCDIVFTTKRTTVVSTLNEKSTVKDLRDAIELVWPDLKNTSDQYEFLVSVMGFRIRYSQMQSTLKSLRITQEMSFPPDEAPDADFGIMLVRVNEVIIAFNYDKQSQQKSFNSNKTVQFVCQAAAEFAKSFGAVGGLVFTFSYTDSRTGAPRFTQISKENEQETLENYIGQSLIVAIENIGG